MGQANSFGTFTGFTNNRCPNPNCNTSFTDSDKFCRSCGAPHPVVEAARAHGLPPSPGRPGRTPLARHESLRRVRTNTATCGFCRKQNESGARYCAGCGEGLLVSVSPPYWDTLRSGLPEEKPHPMGKEALVTQLGMPTKKMEAFADALLELLCQEVPSHKRLVDIPRLKYLERAFDRQAQFTLSSLRPDLILRIFKSLGFEHEIISFPPPMTDSSTPALTQRGLLTYLVHGLLYDPDEAIREFNSLLAQGKVPPPPRWLGGKTWHMERSMALAAPHPDAIRVNKQMMYDLQNYGIMHDGWDVREERGGSGSPRERPATITMPPMSPSNAPYPPYGYGWPSYPPSPYHIPSPYIHSAMPWSPQLGYRRSPRRSGERDRRLEGDDRYVRDARDYEGRHSRDYEDGYARERRNLR